MDVLRFVDSMESVVLVSIAFAIKDDGEMILCDSCEHFEHLSCIGRLEAPKASHKCNFCVNPEKDLMVYFF